MISPQQVVAIWRQSGIVRAHPTEVGSVRIPDEAKRLLVEVGLPREAELGVSFTLDEGVWTLDAFAQKIGVTPRDDASEFIRIGTDGRTQLCVAIGSGAVFAVDPAGKLPCRFVSSSLIAFLELLSLYHNYAERVQSLGEDQADTLVEQVAQEMSSVDSAAFDGPENWWSVIVEQMRDGLL